jgi:hypothetical protein
MSIGDQYLKQGRSAPNIASRRLGVSATVRTIW